MLFRDINSFSVFNFSSFKVLYCLDFVRTTKVADALAAFGVKMVVDPQAVWPGDAPSFVQDLVANDKRYCCTCWLMKKKIDPCLFFCSKIALAARIFL